MVLFLYILVLNLLVRCSVSVSSPYTMNITISYEDKSGYLSDGAPFMVTENETFTIHVSSDKPTHKMWCCPENKFCRVYFDSELVFIKIDSDGKNNHNIYNVKATPDMSGNWHCVASTRLQTNSISFDFAVNVTKLSSLDTSKCDAKPCHDLANCTNTVGSFKCSCHPGYTGDGFTCTDINECVEVGLNGLFACSDNSHCQNVPGAYNCSCLNGYSGNAYEQNGCIDVNECENPDVCRAFPGSKCLNSVGSYKCSCPEGNAHDPHTGCGFPDACAKHSCGTNALCESLSGSSYCSCPKGFHADPFKHCYPDQVTKTTTENPLELGVPASGQPEIGQVTKTTTENSLKFEVKPASDHPETHKELRARKVTSPYIIISLFKKKGAMHYYTYSMLILNQPFTINLKFSTDVKSYEPFTNITCCIEKHRHCLTEPLNRINKKDYTANMKKATITMNDMWKCKINGTKKNLEIFTVSFRPKFVNAVVEFTKEPVTKNASTTPRIGTVSSHENLQNPVGSGTASSVFVNDVNITTNALDRETIGYDRKGEYWYHEGEVTKITCQKIIGMMHVTLPRYGDTPVIISTQLLDLVNQTVYLKLTSEYNGSYIACNVQGKISPVSWNTVRLYLYKFISNSANDFPTFSVNGLVLAPAKGRDNVKYVYEFFDQEVLSIKVSMNRLECISITEDIPDALKGIFNNEFFNVTVTMDRPCFINCQTSSKTFRFELKYETTTFDPAINGLSFAQTQMKYKLNEQTSTIVYKNTGNRELNLSCSSIHSGCEWKTNNKKVFKQFHISTETGIYKSYYNFIPEQSYVTTNIIECICLHDYKQYKVVAEIINDIMASKHEPTLEPAGAIGDGPDNSISMKNILIIVGVTLAVVILVVWLIVGIHKRKRKLEQAQASEINYENLGDGLMPTPRQWDADADIEDTYANTVPNVDNNVEEMYAKPQPKSQRQPSKEILYAEVGGLDEPNYASVETKGKKGRKTDHANLRKQMPIYSQIQSKNLRDTKQCAPQVLPKLNDVNYAQVVPKSLRNQPEASKYANLPQSQQHSYVNAQAKEQTNDEYAEPAYCEVNLNK